MIQNALDGIANNIRRELNIAAFGYVPMSVPEKPAAVCLVNDVDYNLTSGKKLTQLNVTVALVISRTDEEQAIKSAHAFMSPSGPNSIKAAIESDRTLNGTAQDCRVTNAEEVTFSDIGSDSVLISQFQVEVYL